MADAAARRLNVVATPRRNRLSKPAKVGSRIQAPSIAGFPHPGASPSSWNNLLLRLQTPAVQRVFGHSCIVCSGSPPAPAPHRAPRQIARERASDHLLVRPPLWRDLQPAAHREILRHGKEKRRLARDRPGGPSSPPRTATSRPRPRSFGACQEDDRSPPPRRRVHSSRRQSCRRRRPHFLKSFERRPLPNFKPTTQHRTDAIVRPWIFLPGPPANAIRPQAEGIAGTTSTASASGP